ncbi:MAG: hypothetical protein MZU97_24310 [Bacillus subtilis]|nr:hypothetical protein [Bacillus subtilis]
MLIERRHDVDQELDAVRSRTHRSQHRLIRVDFFDQGQSAKLLQAKPTRRRSQVESARGAVSTISAIAKAVVVGISYGGEVALQFAIRLSLTASTVSSSSTRARTRARGSKTSAAAGSRPATPATDQHYYQTTIPVIYSPHFYETEARLDEEAARDVLVPSFRIAGLPRSIEAADSLGRSLRRPRPLDEDHRQDVDRRRRRWIT